MTNETRSPKEIEREIETQRSELTSNLEDLQDKFSIDTLVRQIGDQFREHGGDMGRSISDQVKGNPIPLALTGIGLAWMIFGNSQKPAPASGFSRAEDDYRRSTLASGRPYTPPASATPSYDNSPSWSHDEPDDNAPSATDRLSAGAANAKDKVNSGVESAKSGVASAASSAISAIASGAESVQSSVSAAGNRISEGTESLTEEGRKRVIAARQKAVEMKRSAMRSVSDGADVATDFYDNQPLVIGALALAVGAALGGALPRTKVEDDLMGDQSDTLYDEAESIFEEEKAKAMKVAESVKDEVKDIAAETKADLDNGAPVEKNAAQAVGDKAKSMANRVAEAAKTTAKDEDLGKPKT